MKAKGLTKTSVKKYLTHQMYVDRVLKDERVISCKMNKIQSKNFRMYTQYIWKKALINYENKRYWLDSIYSLPFGHPWINKIENGSMRIEDAVNQIKGDDKYTYELNAYNLGDDKKIKRQSSQGYISLTNPTEEQLNIVADRRKTDFSDRMLSNPNGLLLFRSLIQSS